MDVTAFKRHRRLRRTAGLRGLVRETELTPAHLIYPIFVDVKLSGRTPIAAISGQYRLGLDALADETASLRDLSIPAELLFEYPQPTTSGGAAWRRDGGVQQAGRGSSK